MSEKETKLVPTEKGTETQPFFVETEKLLERLADITRETASRAHDFFVERGSRFGNHFEDWLRAESEVLRAAPVKITEANGNINVMIAAPGFKPEEIEVSIKDDTLIVSGETEKEEKKEDEKTFYSEWKSNRFLRKLSLPTGVEPDGAEATLQDGVLKLVLKKKAETEVSKVAVKAA
jgi:HSP20 family protein